MRDCEDTAEIFQATRPGGKVVLVGMGHPVYSLPVSVAAVREVDIIGSFRYANAYTTGIDILSIEEGGVPDFSKLITHRYQGLDSVNGAFQMAGTTKDETGNLVIKVIIEILERTV